MSAEEQKQLLADYILANIPGEPSRSEGFGDVAVRLLRRYRYALDCIMHELGVPQPGYPAPVANAYEIAADALSGKEEPWFMGRVTTSIGGPTLRAVDAATGAQAESASDTRRATDA